MHEMDQRFTIDNNNVGQVYQIPLYAGNTDNRSTYLSTNLTQHTKWNVNNPRDVNYRGLLDNLPVITVANKDDQDMSKNNIQIYKPNILKKSEEVDEETKDIKNILDHFNEEEKTLTKVISKKPELNVNIMSMTDKFMIVAFCLYY